MDEIQRRQELEGLMSDQSKVVQQGAADQLPPKEGEPNIDEDHLLGVLKYCFLNDLQDKENAEWGKKRKYDLNAYYGIKNAFFSNYPWPNASNFPEPITPVLLDVGHSAIMDAIFRDMGKTVTVAGVGEEDQKNAKGVSSIMNWMVGTNIEDMYLEMDFNIFQTMLHGTSYLKMIKTYREVDEQGMPNLDSFAIAPATIPMGRIFLPIDSKSPYKDDTDRVTQIVPWSAGDLIDRKRSGLYKNLDKIGRGTNPTNTTEKDLLEIQKKISGLDLSVSQNRDTYFIAETYITYYPKDSLKAIDLIVWWSPATGQLLRYVENSDGIRPFSDYYIYPLHGFAFHQSLPDLIKNIQDKANYTDKQVTDAADKAISPAGFYKKGSQFDPAISMRSPSAMYEMTDPGSIAWEPVNIAPLMERRAHIDQLWLKAERRTGFTDIFQGINGPASDTLGGDVMRSKRADIRFSTIYNRINSGWKKSMNQIYYYTDKYMPRKTKLRILGSQSFQTIDQIFPKSDSVETYGLKIGGKYDFNLAGRPISEIEDQNRRDVAVCDSVLADPVLGQDPSNRYKAQKKKAEAMGMKDFTDIVRKPKGADILDPSEIINALIGGATDIQPAIEINPVDYKFELMKFMQTANFKESSKEIKAEFQKFLDLVEGIRIGKVQAFQDVQTIQGKQKAMQVEAAVKAKMEAEAAGQPLPQEPPPAEPVPQEVMQ